MNICRLLQLSCFGSVLRRFNQVKTTVDDYRTDPCVESSPGGIKPVNIFKYFIKTCIQYFQSVCFSFCITKTKIHHSPVVAPVQLLLGFAVSGLAAADKVIYVLLFANQTIFQFYIPGREHTTDPGNNFFIYL